MDADRVLDQLTPLEPRRASDEVADRIRDIIIGQGLAEGDRLPSERRLAEQLGLSRPTVSQALRSLSMVGLVEIRQGSGVCVTHNPAAGVSSSLSTALRAFPGSTPQLLQLRYWVEKIAAVEVTKNHDEAVLGSVADALERLRRSTTGSVSEHVTADALFHAAIVEGADNVYLDAVYGSVHTAVVKLSYKEWIARDERPPWRRSPAELEEHYQIHREIFDSLRSGDLDRLDAALLAHHEMFLDHIDRVGGFAGTTQV